MKFLKESSYAENIHSWSSNIKNKLDTITSAGYWNDLDGDVEDECEAIVGFLPNEYRTLKSSYSDYTREEVLNSIKTMYKLIDKYYQLSLDLKNK